MINSLSFAVCLVLFVLLLRTHFIESQSQINDSISPLKIPFFHISLHRFMITRAIDMGLSHVVSLLYFFIFLTNFAFLVGSEFAPPPQAAEKPKEEPGAFKPSIAVTVGVLTVIFSFTFLLLLYAKHCRRGDSSNAFSIGDSRPYPTVTARKNSGVNRAVVESLPIFRFESLKGQKDGLECAVCLNKFEFTDVLRLLPKCKHAFHVECVDTWLDAHSTCPLCRYRVDPEDILLVEDNRNSQQSANASRIPSTNHSPKEVRSVSRVSGRHSFAGGNSIEVIVEKPPRIDPTTSFNPRRSLDSWSFKKKKNPESVAIGCFDNRPRKDGLLLAEKTNTNGSGSTEQRRLEHRIIVSGNPETEKPGFQNHRWSDIQPSELLFLQSETILSDSHRFLKGRTLPAVSTNGGASSGSSNNESGREVIKGRSMSEITGMGRYRSNEEQQREYEQRQQERKRQAGAVSRWLAWISQSQSQTNQN